MPLMLLCDKAVMLEWHKGRAWLWQATDLESHSCHNHSCHNPSCHNPAPSDNLEPQPVCVLMRGRTGHLMGSEK